MDGSGVAVAGTASLASILSPLTYTSTRRAVSRRRRTSVFILLSGRFLRVRVLTRDPVARTATAHSQSHTATRSPRPTRHPRSRLSSNTTSVTLPRPLRLYILQSSCSIDHGMHMPLGRHMGGQHTGCRSQAQQGCKLHTPRSVSWIRSDCAPTSDEVLQCVDT